MRHRKAKAIERIYYLLFPREKGIPYHLGKDWRQSEDREIRETPAPEPLLCFPGEERGETG